MIVALLCLSCLDKLIPKLVFIFGFALLYWRTIDSARTNSKHSLYLIKQAEIILYFIFLKK